MSSAAPHVNRTPGDPLLIAVAGVGRGSGVTTTTIALARTWPGPEQAVLVEADPAGGQLAEATGADPYRGLASMARAAHAGTKATVLELTEHLQILPCGVAYLASPPGPDTGSRAAWISALLTGNSHDQRTGNPASWKDSGVTVFADCGVPEPGSVTASILTGADAGLIVVRADRDDPVHARRRIRELTDYGHRRAVLLLGFDPDSDYARALDLPVMALLPHEPYSATALLHRTCPWLRRNRLLPAARAVAAAVETQLRPPSTAPRAIDTDAQRAHPAVRRRFPGRPGVGPTVYRIDPPVSPSPGRGPALGTESSPVPHGGSAHTDASHRSGPDTEGPAITTPPRSAATPDVVSRPAERDTALTAPLGPDSPVSGTSPTTTGPDTEPAATDAATAAPKPVSREPVPLLSVEVFGPLRVLWRPGDQEAPVEITRALRPRERELLTLLAVHPTGATRDTVIDALWPEHNSRRPTNTLNTVVSRLRNAIGTASHDMNTEFIDYDKSRYRLGPGLWAVDYFAFDAAVTALRTATGTGDRERACRAILGAADGVLGEELTAEWIAPIREHARRDRLKALGKLAAMLVEADPDQTLALLETALALDPTNEPIYQDILRLHARLGERTVINPTVALLKRRLESIGDIPTQRTLDIARTLRDQHASERDTKPGPDR